MYFTYVWTNAIGKYSCLVWLGFMVGERWPINLSFLLFSSLFHVLCCIGPSIACCLQLWLMLVNGHGRPVGDPRPEQVRVWASKWTRGGHGFFSGSDSSVAGTGLGGQNPTGLCPLPTLAAAHVQGQMRSSLPSPTFLDNLCENRLHDRPERQLFKYGGREECRKIWKECHYYDTLLPQFSSFQSW